MNAGEPRGNACRFGPELAAYLQDELPPAARRALEEHLASCPACAKQVEEYRAVIERVSRPLPEIPAPDLAPVIIARIRGAGAPARRRFAVPWVRAAALLVCLVLAGALVWRWRAIQQRATVNDVSRDRFVAAALGWLRASQEPEGCWDAGKWGAQRNYTPGITALAALALLQEPGAHGAAVDRALDYLLLQQNADGRFGILCSGTPYNQGLATLALLKAGQQRADPGRTEAVNRALEYIRSTQLKSGGWDYPRSAPDAGNTSVTVWQLLALLEADATGRQEIRPSIERGLAWLGRMTDAEGRVGYSRPGDFPNGHLTLTAAAAVCLLRHEQAHVRSAQLARLLEALRRDVRPNIGIDYYRYYFLTQAFRAGGAAAGNATPELRESLLACQAKAGPAAGSCEPADPWSAAGGRVYATAMAVLAM